jgi:uncharacterized protein (TIGR03546 family)
MLIFLTKLIGNIIKELHSKSSPGQIGAGMALGAIIGLTPFWCLHNLIIFMIIMLVNVSSGGAAFAAVIFSLIAFAFDPLANALGYWLLVEADALKPMWTAFYNMPVIPLTKFNNTLVLGSLIISLVLLYPVYKLAIYGVKEYRLHLKDKIEKIRFFKILKATRFAQWYIQVSGIGK